VAVALDGVVIFGARLGGNDVADPLFEIGVPGGGQSDGLREYRSFAGAGHAVERLVPPTIGRHAEPLDGGRLVLHLADFFFEGHTADQIGGAFFGGEIGITVHRGVGGLAGERQGQRQGDRGLHELSCHF
jgi:hypothetical protein